MNSHSNRPTLFDTENQARSAYQLMRYLMLTDRFQKELSEWLQETVGEEHAQVWGVPDTTLNPIAAQTRQLTTPGLYGRAPTRRGPSEDLVGARGAMRSYWTRMQAVQYLAVGMGVWFQHVTIRTDGQLVYRSVKPFNVVPWTSEEDPTELVALWELRWREVVDSMGKVRGFYTWDQWDLGDLHRGGSRPPSYHVVQALQGGGAGDDVSEHFIRNAEGESVPALVGDAYWWREEDGTPFLPFLVHRPVDDGEFWPDWRRAMHTGTLRACTLWTYVHRSALYATGEHTLIGGVDMEGVPGQDLRLGDNDKFANAVPQVSMQVHPGMMTFLPLGDNGNLQSVTIGAGVNLPNLANFANQYNMMLATVDGLNPTDTTRQSANPTSGAALTISAASRREFSDAVKPVFHETDFRAIAMSARIRTLNGFPTPTAGYAIEYHTIPLSPTEQGDLRVQVEWEEDRGQIGPVEAYMRVHSGVDRETALRAVVQAAVEKAQVDQLVTEALAVMGVVRPEPPTQPSGTDEDAEDEEDPNESEEDTPDESTDEEE